MKRRSRLMVLERERVSVLLTEPYLDGLDRLVKEGIYLDRQSVIRDAIWQLLEKHRIPPFYRRSMGGSEYK